jgi:hypothetical protein
VIQDADAVDHESTLLTVWRFGVASGRHVHILRQAGAAAAFARCGHLTSASAGPEAGAFIAAWHRAWAEHVAQHPRRGVSPSTSTM